MKIDHKIERQIDIDALTPEAILTFWKYSIGDYNLNDERTMRCMEVVLRCIELGMLKDNIAHALAEIIDEIMDKITKVIKNVKKKLTTGTTFVWLAWTDENGDEHYYPAMKNEALRMLNEEDWWYFAN